MLGATAQVAFAAAYTIACRRLGWIPSVLVGSVAFFVVGFAVPPLPPFVTYGLLVASVAVFVATLGRRPATTTATLAPPAWDIPARIVIATVLVVTISSIAPVIGGRFAGVLATFPVYAAVLATFAHITQGPGPASDVLRGLAMGLLGFGAFFLALGFLLGVTGIALSFAGALAVGFVVQMATLPLVRRATQAEEPVEPAGLE